MSQLITNLNVGDKIKLGNYKVESEESQPIVWQIADQNHAGYPEGAVTLITEKVIDLRGFDGKESGNANSSRVSGGNNRYRTSNIRQWLNSIGLANSWFAPQNLTDGTADTNNHDAPPDDANFSYTTGYTGKDGFLNSFSKVELARILDTDLTVVKNSSTDGGGNETVTDKVFLLSATEVGFSNENGIAEGSKLALFNNSSARNAYATQQAITNTRSSSKPSSVTSYWTWMLRTPYFSYPQQIRYVATNGSENYSTSLNGNYGLRPALNLSPNILVSDTVDADGYYVPIWTRKYIVTLDKPITLATSDKLIKYKFNPKVNNQDMAIKEIDNEKLIFESDDLTDKDIKLAIEGRNARIDKIAYTVS